jgi:hypothetical protein
VTTKGDCDCGCDCDGGYDIGELLWPAARPAIQSNDIILLFILIVPNCLIALVNYVLEMCCMRPCRNATKIVLLIEC